MKPEDALTLLIDEVTRAAQPYQFMLCRIDGRWIAAVGTWADHRWTSESYGKGEAPVAAVRDLAESMRSVGMFEVCPGEDRRPSPPVDAALLSRITGLVPRCLAVLFEEQTPDERASEETLHLNARGFDIVDAPSLTRAAAFVIAGGRLNSEERSRIARRLVRYRRQLAEVLRTEAA